MTKCPRCGYHGIEVLGIRNLVDSGKEGDLVTRKARCVKCGFAFDFDDFVPREKPEGVNQSC